MQEVYLGEAEFCSAIGSLEKLFTSGDALCLLLPQSFDATFAHQIWGVIHVTVFAEICENRYQPDRNINIGVLVRLVGMEVKRGLKIGSRAGIIKWLERFRNEEGYATEFLKKFYIDVDQLRQSSRLL